MNKDTQIGLRITERMREEIAIAAKVEDRSFSDMARILLQQALMRWVKRAEKQQ